MAPSDEERGDSHGTTVPPHPHHQHYYDEFRPALDYAAARQRVFWDRFRGKGKKKVGLLESLENTALSSYLNVLLVFLPFAWASHFLLETEHSWGHRTVFALSFITIIPLEKLFDWGGEQMAIFLGKDLGDLLIITLNNAVEATLAIILLARCELRLLQATIIGVVVLHLLLIPGTAFFAGGATIWEQSLHPHNTQLNHSLLLLGVLSLMLPTAFFAALDRGTVTLSATGNLQLFGTLINDATRDQLLRMSRGLAVILLVVYIASRVFLANPPGEQNALSVAPNAPPELHKELEELENAEPEINPFYGVVFLLVTVGIMAVTAEWLVESIESVREAGNIEEEWFGLILLPIVSFSADGVVAIIYFVRKVIRHFTGKKYMDPSPLAKARAIDLSIQFTLFWMPFLVLLGWWINKPMHLMFDYFEVAILLGSCFLVNYVTADAKTNWVEGLVMVSFYFMIAIVAWFYTGQPEMEPMLFCPSVEAFIAGEAAGEGTGGQELIQSLAEIAAGHR
ncbi:Ca(2+):cation antiporter (CaCA) family protein [Abortiporus biennis]